MTIQSIEFAGSTGFTLGVEIEFQVVNRQSYDLVPHAPQLQQSAPQLLQPRISQELIKSILEIQTGICRDLTDVENDLMQTCALAEELALDNDCLLFAASLHPFAKAREQELSSDARYQRIMNELQIVGRRFISQGLHIHVGVADGDTAIRVCNVIQAYLPLFLALSTSSPFFEGEDTGLMSYRTVLFESLPLAGVYDYHPGWLEFEERVNKLRGLGIIDSARDLWWDARPSPQFGTVEIRICDLPYRFSDILAIVSLVQACVSWISEENITTESLDTALVKANKWQVVRHGLHGRYLDPAGNIDGGQQKVSEAIKRLIDMIVSWSSELGSLEHLADIGQILAEGTGTEFQRRVLASSHDFKEIIKRGQEGFWK
ncbi:MAG: YbdK family carboxylate-amine ligase [Desulfobulbaceae bacterium]|nr:MAG: YbdK family carboxylate-amine ligase [Desulfobulbaceae bacterium]